MIDHEFQVHDQLHSSACPAMVIEAPPVKVPGRIGRPPGSKNKKTVAKLADSEDNWIPYETEKTLKIMNVENNLENIDKKNRRTSSRIRTLAHRRRTIE